MSKSSQYLNSLVAKNECGGLNIEGDSDISPIFDNSNITIKSNCGDATMIISIKFINKINITAIEINGVSEETNPKLLKCYVNKIEIDFSDVTDIPSTQQFDLSNDINKQVKVNVPRWKNVSELTMYFENEEADQLDIKQIKFIGTSGDQNINIGEMKKSEDENYVPIKGNEVTEGIFSLKDGETIESFLHKNPGKYIFVDFHAKWCVPWKQLGPILCQNATARGAIVLKVDIDQHQSIAVSNGISSIPVVVLYKDGLKIDSMVGFNPQRLDQMLSLVSN